MTRLLVISISVWLTLPLMMSADAQDLPTSSASPALDQTTTSVEVSYEVSLEGRTPAEAEHLALERARAEAVRKVVGTQVQSERALSQIETEDELVERFSQVIRVEASGRVIKEEILESKITSTNGFSVMSVRIRAVVRPESGQPDPGYRATLQINDDDQIYIVRDSPRSSDELFARISVTKDSHLTLFSIARDTVQVLWPNAQMKETFVSANSTVTFPSQDWRNRGLRLRASLPEDVQRSTERLFLVATKKDIPFYTESGFREESSDSVTRKTDLYDLNRWLSNIPLSERTTATVTYDVRRTE